MIRHANLYLTVACPNMTWTREVQGGGYGWWTETVTARYVEVIASPGDVTASVHSDIQTTTSGGEPMEMRRLVRPDAAPVEIARVADEVLAAIKDGAGEVPAASSADVSVLRAAHALYMAKP
jgi:hypothetical protein